MISSTMLASARRRMESLMDSTVVIRRKTDELRDKTNGRVTATWETIYEGPARARFTSAQPHGLDVGGQRSTEQQPTVGLPIGDDPRIVTGTSAAVHVDDEGTVTANRYDPGIVGTRFRVAGVHSQTHSTARRLPVEVFTHV